MVMLVVKVGGRVLDLNMQAVIRDIVELYRKDEKIVLIHGGGDMVTKYSIRLGIKPRFVVSPSGVRSRYTTREELEVYIMVMAGKINKEIVSQLIALGVKAIGISGIDGSILIAERKKRIIIVDERGRKRVVEGGYTGRIIKVNNELINTLLSQGYLVVIAPIAVDPMGIALNVDADQVAFHIAKSLNAERLLILTDVEGLLINGVPVKRLNISEIENLLQKVGAGMNRKLIYAAKLAGTKVREVIISSGLKEKPIIKALKGEGTIIVNKV